MLIGGIGIAVIVLAVSGFFVYWHIRLTRSIEAIRASGDPVMPADMVVPPASRGTDPVAWLRSLPELDETYEHWNLMETASIAEMSQRAQSGRFRPEIAAALEDYARCSEQLDDATIRPFWNDLDRVLFAAVPANRLSDCQRAALLSRAVAFEPWIEKLDHMPELAEYDAVTPLQKARDVKGVIEPDFGVRDAMLCSEVLVNTAPPEALLGNPALAIERLKSAFRLARAFADGKSAFVNDLHYTLLYRALAGLSQTLSLLPPRLDLSSLDVEIGRVEPRKELIAALKGERVRINFVYGDFDRIAREYPMHTTGDALEHSCYWLFFARDQAICPERFETGLLRISMLYKEVKATRFPSGEQRDEYPKFAVVGEKLMRNFDTRLDATVDLEARLLLARCALIAYRDGADAGRREAAKLIDPFDGQPLRSRIDPDGMLVLWSVDKDGIDDNAASNRAVDSSLSNVGAWTQSSDLVWSLRLR